MDDSILRTADNKIYVAAASTYTDSRIQVLNHVDSFGVFDRWGDAHRFGAELVGVYHKDTRFVSVYEFRIDGRRPHLLSSSVKEANEVLSVDLTNPALSLADGTTIPEGVIHVERSKFIHGGVCYERIQLKNFSHLRYSFPVSLFIDGDFRDIFELRGYQREKRGEMLPLVQLSNASYVISYHGLDKILRRTEVGLFPAPDSLEGQMAIWNVDLEAKATFELASSVALHLGDAVVRVKPFREAIDKVDAELRESNHGIVQISSSNQQFNHWLNRSRLDLISLTAITQHGQYPYAGVPWYNTAFGRDGIITALQSLWAVPSIAKGVLTYCAATQAISEDAFNDAEPGKIFHETRGGEMSELSEVPFRFYYGAVDSTPLFIILAAAYYERTGDLTLIDSIWPNIMRALQWIDNCGDIDGDGFVEYHAKRQAQGIRNQGWKDSVDCISHEDGTLAETPLALCEVQGYVYQAKMGASRMASVLGDHSLAANLRSQAELLQKRFHESFWDERLGTFVLALDSQKRPCRVVSSNPAHCLYSGIVYPEYAERVVRSLLSPEMYTGWGIRTLSATSERYNPMSYHNGSVWPHDNALAADGMARYGFRAECLMVMRGMFEASKFLELGRLPELFCGFWRRYGEGPTHYPVSCSPQAWATGTAFMLLRSCLALEINGVDKTVVVRSNSLPNYLNEITLSNIPLGEGTAEISFSSYANDVGLTVRSKPSDWTIMSVK